MGLVSTRTRFVVGLVLTLLQGPGCWTSEYLTEQAYGQFKILHDRKRITELLKNRDLPPDWRAKLKLVLAAREYSHKTIGLIRTGAYTYFYDTGGNPIAYNLSAAPKDALTPKLWTFPVVGSLPYVGFFDHSKGVKSENELASHGLDTYLRPVPAYSSLGWFDDPIFSSMLDTDLDRLIEIVIHETTHSTIFLRNQVAFNESLAVFVGQQGTLDFLAHRFGAGAPEVTQTRKRIQNRQKFAALITELYSRIDTLYKKQIPRATKLQEREVHFVWAQKEYKRIFVEPREWGAFVQRPLNNAVLLSYGRYNQGLEFHIAAYNAMGKDLARMVSLYKKAQYFDNPIQYVAKRCGLIEKFSQTM
ncbi:MAG: aminopeptidase [Pseudomonadota bacterium]